MSEWIALGQQVGLPVLLLLSATVLLWKLGGIVLRQLAEQVSKRSGEREAEMKARLADKDAEIAWLRTWMDGWIARLVAREGTARYPDPEDAAC